MSYNDDPLPTVIAFSIIIIAAMAAIIGGKIRQQQAKLRTTSKNNYESSSGTATAARDNNTQPHDAELSLPEQTSDPNYIVRTANSVTAIWTEALTKWTAVLAGGGIFAAIFAAFSLSAIRGQLEEIRIDNRAWVSADVQIAEEFIFDPANPIIELTFRYKNTGKSPAIGVNGLFDAIAIFEGTDAAVSKLRAVCENASASGTGFPLFPGDDIRGDQRTTVSVSSEQALRHIFNPIILTCVGYTPVGDNSPHFTAQSLRLSMKNPRPGKGCCAILLADGPVSKSDLKLEIWQMKGGNFAN